MIEKGLGLVSCTFFLKDYAIAAKLKEAWLLIS